MKPTILLLLVCCFWTTGTWAGEAPVSEDTKACLECHEAVYPGILEDWKLGRMARITPAQAIRKPQSERRVSFSSLPDTLQHVVVGCAECHTLNSERHPDSFEHNGYKVHVVVSPEDCSTCHPVEKKEYDLNLMAHAYGNLKNNSVYQDLANSVNGLQSFSNGRISHGMPDPMTDADSCFSCHGTQITPQGTVERSTDYGDMTFPVLSGWPNQGVGRINPDGSKGACTSCHPRHQYSIAVARKPYTCSQCHKGPDVPAYQVYSVSKHGNIFSSSAQSASWDFDAVPWTVGKNLTEPTCAACHVSLLMSADGSTVAKRTHQMSDRIYERLFGLIYAHPHSASPDTSLIRNKAGLPLPTELTGEPAVQYLIDKKEQEQRKGNMQQVCLACHSNGWVQGHFERLDHTVRTTNAMTLTATQILLSAWDKGIARGLAQKDSIFNEAIEKMWVEQWLFYANSTRLASAMGGADYGVFANGRWYLSKNTQQMLDWIRLHEQGK